MKKDSLFLILICFLLIFTICEKAMAKRKGARKGFSPLANISVNKDSFSKGDELIVSAKGLIANFNSLYIVKLENEVGTYFPEIKDVNAENMTLLIPESIASGDYDFSIKLKSNFLKSKTYLIPEKIKIRPNAISLKLKPDHIFLSNRDIETYVLKEIKSEIDTLEVFEEDLRFYVNGQSFDFGKTRIQEGLNEIQVSYMKDNYESLISDNFEFMFITKYLYEDEISMTGSKLELIRRDVDKSIDVSFFVVKAKDYIFVKAYPNQESFMTELDLSKFLITELKVTGDEHAVIQNNSNEFQSLANCSLADTLMLRYSFSPEIELAPAASLKIKGNLGLNNSSADKLQLICEYPSEEPEFVIEDVFSYSEVDEGGFAIKSE